MPFFPASAKMRGTLSRIVPGDWERAFAEALSGRRDVRLFLKLPRWFAVSTPAGDYNPDWAILFADDGGGERLVLVAETKGAVDAHGNPDWSEMRQAEKVKIRAAAAHFGSKQLGKQGALDGTDYQVAKTAAHLRRTPRKMG